MPDAFTSLGLLALTVVALFSTRGRSLPIRMAVEAALLLAIGVYLALQGTSPLPHLARVPIGLSDAWFRALLVVWWLIAAKLVVNIIVLVRGRDPKSREARLFSDVGSVVIYITTVLIIFNSVLDLDVRGLLVTSGATAIVAGLALQNTLADVFCGLAMGLEQPFHVGDRVSVGDNLEGVVVQMNWRSIRIHTDEDDLATLPNSLVAKAQIINRSVPTKRRAAKVEIVAPADAAPELVLPLQSRSFARACDRVPTQPISSWRMRRVYRRQKAPSWAISVGYFGMPALGDRHQCRRRNSSAPSYSSKRSRERKSRAWRVHSLSDRWCLVTAFLSKGAPHLRCM